LSRKVHYEIGEITALCHLADIFSSTGNYSNALEHALEGFKKSEETGDKNLMARCLNTLGGVYALARRSKTSNAIWIESKIYY
jgi:hypothetical protein